MSSTISAAAAALDDTVTTAASDSTSALYQVQTTFGPPLDDEEQEVFAILGIADPIEDARALGADAKRNERYRIETTVKVYDPTADNTREDRRAVWDRAWQLADAVRTLIEADTTLAGTVTAAHVASQRTDGLAQPIGEDNKRLPGWVIQIHQSIACRARA